MRTRCFQRLSLTADNLRIQGDILSCYPRPCSTSYLPGEAGTSTASLTSHERSTNRITIHFSPQIRLLSRYSRVGANLPSPDVPSHAAVTTHKACAQVLCRHLTCSRARNFHGGRRHWSTEGSSSQRVPRREKVGATRALQSLSPPGEALVQRIHGGECRSPPCRCASEELQYLQVRRLRC